MKFQYDAELIIDVDFERDAGFDRKCSHWIEHRAWIDCGFPSHSGVYRYAYLHVPFKHVDEDWDKCQGDAQMRCYAPYELNDKIRIKTLGVLHVCFVEPIKVDRAWKWRICLSRKSLSKDECDFTSPNS